MIAWGSNFPLTKLGLNELPPLVMTTARFVLTAALLLPFVRPPVGQFRPILLLAFTFGFVHFALFFGGMKDIEGGAGAVAIQAQVPFSALLAALLYNDRLGWRRALGMALALAGIVVVAGAPNLDGNYIPFAMVVASGLVWSVTNIQAKRLGGIDANTVTAYVALFAAPQTLLASLLLEDGQMDAIANAGWNAVAAIVYLSVVVSIIGYAVWYRMVQLYPINMVTPFALLIPVIGIASSAVVLGEQLTWQSAVGSAMTLVGVAIIVIRRPALAEPRP
jgi:O-acetylserine/cysteine efflux transporter